MKATNDGSEVFDSRVDAAATERFVAWTKRNPDGFYLNRKTSRAAMLHRVGCGHLGQPGEWTPDWGDLTRRAKICSRDRDALKAWGRAGGVVIRPCADCL